MTIEDLSRVLAEHSFARGLRDEDVHFLAGCTRNLRVPAGQTLAREGEPASTLFLLRSGQVALEAHGPGKVYRVETVGEGDVLGWSVVNPPHVWHLDLLALTPVLAFGVDGECLRGKMEKDHSFGFHVTRSLLGRVHQRLTKARLAQLDVFAS